MYVDDCYINSSFFLSILLFSIAFPLFANCPNRRIKNAKVSCSHFPSRVLVNGSYFFDTAAILDFDQIGPCGFYPQPHIAVLTKVDTAGRDME